MNAQTSAATAAFVSEPERQIPLDAAYDVAVAGGGIAGVAAALAAVRQGMRVVLIEKQFGLGGLATLGHVVKYLPLCDGFGRQVMGGIAEELLHHSVAELKGAGLPAAGFVPVPDCWKAGEGTAGQEDRRKKRYMSSFNPYAFQMAMERLLEAEGVTLMYDTRVCQVLKRGDEIAHLIVENKSGRLAIAAEVFVDASGDADLAFLTGCPVETYRHNVLCGWYYEINDGKVRLVSWSNPYDKEHRGGNNAVGPFFSGTDHRDVTRQVIDSRRLLLEKLAKKQEASPESVIYPFALTSIPTFRVTRRLQNRFSLGECHRHTWLDDCVGMTGDWRRKGPVYPIPLRAIHADDCPNLFVAGRCMSSDHTVIDVTRAIGTCAVTGQASGMAAALLIRERIEDRRRIPVGKLQAALRKAGVIIDADLARPHPDANAAGE
ncbi:FAD-dependent oxidoreductase [Opitutaceae bacterium TAV4]|nr:FAD-dependent oxidoreductase [Opitutaceae bacterium TAV4]RRJ98321.1 FAD-dependent oxidoreductase [Opitutaceae bacterium TAV3]